MPSSKWQKCKTKKLDCVGGDDDDADVYCDDDGVEDVDDYDGDGGENVAADNYDDVVLTLAHTRGNVWNLEQGKFCTYIRGENFRAIFGICTTGLAKADTTEAVCSTLGKSELVLSLFILHFSAFSRFYPSLI